MATYKVLQDIEAEDKLLGPLTMRQFIYAIIVFVSGFIMFRLLFVNWLLALPLLPHTIFFAVLAAPFGHDQSSEVWLLAKVRFFLKPRRRIWNQSGIKELVTVTAPKRVEHNMTNGLSQTEVKSRLEALANTIDSRGWSVKNVNVNLFAQPAYATAGTSDRLVDASMFPQQVSDTDVTASDDILDERNNPTAQHLDAMVTASSQSHRQQLVSQMQGASATVSGGVQNNSHPQDYWFMSQNTAPLPPGLTTAVPQTVAPGQTPVTPSAAIDPDEEQAILEKIHKDTADESQAFGRMRTLRPLSPGGGPAVQPQSNDTGQATSSKPADPAIIELANNDDLNVATIARQADKARRKGQADDEVIISLH